MRYVLTEKEINDKGWWENYCKLSGIDYYAKVTDSEVSYDQADYERLIGTRPIEEKKESKFSRFNVVEVEEIDCKRFSLPLVIPYKCPLCGALGKLDLNTHYIMYPKTNSECEIYACCDGCEEGLTFKAKLNISLDVDLDNIEEQ